MADKGKQDATIRRQQGSNAGNIFDDIKDILGVNNQQKNQDDSVIQLPPPPEQKQPFKLKNKFRLSFHNPNDNITNTNYVEALIKIGDIETIEDFWNFYCHIYRPQDMQAGQFYLFLRDIKPMWEDEANERGGRFNIKMKKGYVNKIWEDLIIGFIGETCEEKELLNGLVLQIKQEQDVIQLWVREIPKAKHQAKQKIQNWIAETIGLDPSLASTTFGYQSHQKLVPNSLPSRKY